MGTRNRVCVPTSSEILAKYELENILKCEIQYRDRPDLSCIVDGSHIGIEVTEAHIPNVTEFYSQRDRVNKEYYANRFNHSDLAKDFGAHLDSEYELFITDTNIVFNAIEKAIAKKTRKNYLGFDKLWLAVYCDSNIHYIDIIKDKIRNIHSEQYAKVFIIGYSDGCVYEIYNHDIQMHKACISNKNDDFKKLVIRTYLELLPDSDIKLRRYLRVLLNNYDAKADICSMKLDRYNINNIIKLYAGIDNFLQ